VSNAGNSFCLLLRVIGKCRILVRPVKHVTSIKPYPTTYCLKLPRMRVFVCPKFSGKYLLGAGRCF
jgi:hypothetical protein